MPSAAAAAPPLAAAGDRRDRAVRLALAGLVAAALALLGAMTASVDAGRSAQAAQGWPWDEDVAEATKPPLYYAARAGATAALLLAGVAGLAASRRTLPRGHLAWLALLLGAGVLMGARGLSLDDVAGARLAMATGPMAAAVSILAYASAGRERMRHAGRLLDGAAWALSAVAVARFGLATAVREQAVAALGPWLDALFFPAAWLVLAPPRGAVSRARWVPAAVYAAGSVLVQTRLNLVMVALLVAASLFASARREGRPAARLLVAAGAVGGAALAASILLEGTGVARAFEASLLALGARLGEDSRSHQLASFFADVAPWELVLGRGAGAVWRWPGMSLRWAGGTDVGYLSLLLFGGLPLLLGWLGVHALPAWRALRAGARGERLACALVVLLYAARMCSSSFPSLSLDYAAVLLCLGGCLAPAERPAPPRRAA